MDRCCVEHCSPDSHLVAKVLEGPGATCSRSAGCILGELVLGRALFPGKAEQFVLQLICKCHAREVLMCMHLAQRFSLHSRYLALGTRWAWIGVTENIASQTALSWKPAPYMLCSSTLLMDAQGVYRLQAVGGTRQQRIAAFAFACTTAEGFYEQSHLDVCAGRVERLTKARRQRAAPSACQRCLVSSAPSARSRHALDLCKRRFLHCLETTRRQYSRGAQLLHRGQHAAPRLKSASWIFAAVGG
eukprot:5249046-Amphidinium_carterae.1